MEDPAKLGIAATPGQNGTVKMSAAIRDLQTIILACGTDAFRKTADLYDQLIEQCKTMLDDSERAQDSNQAPMTILYNLHNRVTTWHPAERSCFEIEGLEVTRAQQMKATIAGHINEKRKKLATK